MMIWLSRLCLDDCTLTILINILSKLSGRDIEKIHRELEAGPPWVWLCRIMSTLRWNQNQNSKCDMENQLHVFCVFYSVLLKYIIYLILF